MDKEGHEDKGRYEGWKKLKDTLESKYGSATLGFN